MATAAVPATPRERQDPNAVKVVLAEDGRALYFSRAPIPAPGSGSTGEDEPATLRHVGLYAYRRKFLEAFVKWPPGAHEQVENLEQLRALERGARIQVVVRPEAAAGIDTPEDLERAREHLARRLGRPAGRPGAGNETGDGFFFVGGT
jgi:3-deoxy-manno-octulosonate cytidylyltransferase (CMP-KDO synthetase)